MLASASDNSKLMIAVLSDLHCHSMSDTDDRKESHLLTDGLRIPSGIHPIQSLIDLFKNKNIKADVLVCAGDIANKISKSGFLCAWQFLQELKRELRSDHVFYTLGNHDVNSRSTSGDPFKIAKSIHPKFLFEEEKDNNKFWTDGYCLKTISDIADFLIINTAYNHYSETDASCGTFPYEKIVSLDSYLNSLPKSQIRLAILHHHPLLHSFADIDSSDVLPTGDQLLDVLSSHTFNFVIHGHRHQPKIRRYNTRHGSFHVFCAGSFSAFLNEIGTKTRNLFHLLSFDLNTTGGFTGDILSWEFNYGSGWNPSTVQSAAFPHKVFIGPPPKGDLLNEILTHFDQTNISYLSSQKLRKIFPDLFFLLPDELSFLKNSLESDRRIKIIVDSRGNLEGIGEITLP